MRFLKFVLPAVAVLMATTFGAYSYLAAKVDFDFKLDGAAFSDGKLVMADPKLDGFNKDGQPYSMRAARAIQDLTDQSVIQLEGISAELPVGNGVSAAVKAARGTFDRSKNTVDLTSEVTVVTTDGTSAKLQSAFVDIDKGDLKTSDPVAIETKGLQIAADGMGVRENGKLLVFEGRVRVNIVPKSGETDQQAEGKKE